MLAASILGLLPANYADAVQERVEGWAKTGQDIQLLEPLLDQALLMCRGELPERLLGLVERWLHSESLHEQRLGLMALIPFFKEGKHENSPFIFRLLAPLTRAVPSDLQLDLLTGFRAAAHSTPHETAYFLKQTLASPDSLDTVWLVRKLLREFPAETQQNLRQALRKLGK